MKRSKAVLVILIIFAAALSVAITAAGNSAFQDISARCREVSLVVVHGVPYLEVNGSDFYVTSAFNVTATFVFPRAVVEGTRQFYLNALFIMALPANVSYYQAWSAESSFSSQSSGNFFSGDLYNTHNSALLVNGTPLGGTGIGFMNATVLMTQTYPTLNIPQNQDWLSFTSEAEAYLSMYLQGYGEIIGANGTRYYCSLSTSFILKDYPITFYRVGVPVAGWLVYLSSIVIVAASMYLLLYARRGKNAKKESNMRSRSADTHSTMR